MSRTGDFFPLWVKKKEEEGIGVWIVMWSFRHSDRKCSITQFWVQRMPSLIPVKCQTSELAPAESRQQALLCLCAVPVRGALSQAGCVSWALLPALTRAATLASPLPRSASLGAQRGTGSAPAVLTAAKAGGWWGESPSVGSRARFVFVHKITANKPQITEDTFIIDLCEDSESSITFCLAQGA